MFVTLSYAPEHYLPELSPPELSGFIKRLRRYSDQQFRFFGVGEYGEKLGRSHYHLALFGYTPKYVFYPDGTYDCEYIKRAWKKGFHTISEMKPERASYLAHYTVKKLTGEDLREDGRHPEFARMSLRPGIGAEAFLRYCTSSAFTKWAAALENPVIPRCIRINGKRWPVGKYVRQYASDHTGIPTTGDDLEFDEPNWYQREALENQCKGMVTRSKHRKLQNGTPF